ncbi:MAG: protein translocase subunit SecF [Actinomycetaceae bacterium]|nr:protein translocase subunit SecF [Actinomycetaceae bacterium]MDY6083262.1 protein translocase subunit SecF [Actinomycetaceae bacterium]
MLSMYSLGNDLYTGKRSLPVIKKTKLWLSIAALAIIVSIAALFVRGLNLGIEFTGGSQFTISKTAVLDQQPAVDVIARYTGDSAARVAEVGSDTMRIQSSTQKLSNSEVETIRQDLARAYKVDVTDVTSTFIGPSWGQDISKKALQGFIVFVVLAMVGLSLYFRSWRNAAGAMLALFHDLIVSIGVYCLLGFEVTPSTVIGLLTILGYSLYDTVVVFDKVRENTTQLLSQRDYTFAESVNLAVNQTLIRSMNTSITSLMPVASILFIGVLVLNAGTLSDLSLVMFVGLILSTLSSIFIASPLSVVLANSDPRIREHTKQVQELRNKRLQEREQLRERGEISDEDDDADLLAPAMGSIRQPGHRLDNSAQPKRKNRRKK